MLSLALKIKSPGYLRSVNNECNHDSPFVYRGNALDRCKPPILTVMLFGRTGVHSAQATCCNLSLCTGLLSKRLPIAGHLNRYLLDLISFTSRGWECNQFDQHVKTRLSTDTSFSRKPDNLVIFHFPINVYFLTKRFLVSIAKQYSNLN